MAPYKGIYSLMSVSTHEHTGCHTQKDLNFQISKIEIYLKVIFR